MRKLEARDHRRAIMPPLAGTPIDTLVAAAAVGDVSQAYINAAIADGGIDALSAQEGNQSALHAAAACGSRKTCNLLLRAGADPDVQDKLARTPLHLAASRGHLDVCDLLLHHGAMATARATIVVPGAVENEPSSCCERYMHFTFQCCCGPTPRDGATDRRVRSLLWMHELRECYPVCCRLCCVPVPLRHWRRDLRCADPGERCCSCTALRACRLLWCWRGSGLYKKSPLTEDSGREADMEEARAPMAAASSEDVVVE